MGLRWSNITVFLISFYAFYLYTFAPVSWSLLTAEQGPLKINELHENTLYNARYCYGEFEIALREQGVVSL